MVLLTKEQSQYVRVHVRARVGNRPAEKPKKKRIESVVSEGKEFEFGRGEKKSAL